MVEGALPLLALPAAIPQGQGLDLDRNDVAYMLHEGYLIVLQGSSSLPLRAARAATLIANGVSHYGISWQEVRKNAEGVPRIIATNLSDGAGDVTSRVDLLTPPLGMKRKF